MKMNKIILIIDFFIPFVIASNNYIQEVRNIDDYNIVKIFTVHTVTECVLTCQNVTNCDFPGTILLTGNLLECMLLEQKNWTSDYSKESKRIDGDGYKDTMPKRQVNVIKEIGHGTVFETQVKWISKAGKILLQDPWLIRNSLFFMALLKVDYRKDGLQVDGCWGNWQAWSTCTKACIDGIRTRSRVCDHPSPKHNGEYCNGVANETERCQIMYCPDWKENKLIAGETSIGKGKLIATVSVPKEFKLSFDVKATSFRKQYNSVVSIPGVLKVWFKGVDTTKGLMVRSYKMNGGKREFLRPKVYKTGKWIKVVIYQIKGDKGYQFKVEVDGEIFHNMINKQPESVSDAKVLVSSDYYVRNEGFLPGYIKGLSLVVKM